MKGTGLHPLRFLNISRVLRGLEDRPVRAGVARVV